MSAKPHFSIQPAALFFALTALAALTGCSSVKDPVTGANVGSTSRINPVNWITPYKIDIIQGNFVSKEQVDSLRVGMIRDQVKATLGTPLLASLFHADRWDYVFTLKRQGTEAQSYKYTVFFKGDALERFEGDTMPSEAEFISRLDNKRKLGKVPPLEATEEQLKAAERPSKAAASNAAGTPNAAADDAARVYPPLESPAK
jgi:outer membrane protein assembly factor BamE